MPPLHAVLVDVVGEVVHNFASGEDVVEVSEDVVGCECDEFTSTPKHHAEEVVHIKSVGEGDGEPYQRNPGVWTHLLQSEQHRRARWELGEARTEEP